MKHNRLWIATAVVAPVLLSSIRPADDVAFLPRAGSTLTKTFVIDMTSSIDDMELTVKGEESPAPEMVVNTTITSSFSVTDHYDAVGDGRPEVLTRVYTSASSESSVEMSNPVMGDQDVESSAETELEGKTVRFTWDADEEAYEVAFGADDEGEDEELLADLEEDMDLRAMLPDTGVNEGDTWDIDPSVILFALAPGGDWHLEPDNDEAADPSGGGDFSRMLDELDGSATGTYQGSKEVDGHNLGIIALSFEVNSTKDITEMAIEAADAAEAPAGMEQDIQSMDVQFEFSLEGTLLWDLQAGVFHSLELSGDTESVIDSAVTISMMGEEIEVEQAIYVSGTIEVNAHTESGESAE